jgi:hypothetical protein
MALYERKSEMPILFSLVTSRMFDPRSGNVGFVMDKTAPGQVFSEYVFLLSLTNSHSTDSLFFPVAPTLEYRASVKRFV